MSSARVLDPSSIPLKRQSGGNIWATLVLTTLGLIIVAVVSVIILFFVPGIQKQQRLQAEKVQLQNEIVAALDQQQQLKTQTEHMKNSPAYVEHIARDKLNMGRPGETVLRFDPYSASGPASKGADSSSSSMN